MWYRASGTVSMQSRYRGFAVQVAVLGAAALFATLARPGFRTFFFIFEYAVTARVQLRFAPAGADFGLKAHAVEAHGLDVMLAGILFEIYSCESRLTRSAIGLCEARVLLLGHTLQR